MRPMVPSLGFDTLRTQPDGSRAGLFMFTSFSSLAKLNCFILSFLLAVIASEAEPSVVLDYAKIGN